MAFTPDQAVIRSVVFPELVPKSSHSILAATPIIKQPYTRPYRVVLMELAHTHPAGRKLAMAVYDECWTHYSIDPETGHLRVEGPSDFVHGYYFSAGELHLALKKFASRTEAFAANVDSIYDRPRAEHRG